jgi:large subunit ribosomal protein L10
MPTPRKEEAIAMLREKMARAQVTMIGDYRGLSVAEITELRKKLRETGAEVIVAKNTLTLIAARELNQGGIEPVLSGPTALTLAYDDPARTAKVINDFNRGPKKFEIRGAMLGASLVTQNVVDQIAAMPSRQQVLAQVVGGVAGPLNGVVGILNAAIANVAYVLQARIDQLQPPEQAAA